MYFSKWNTIRSGYVAPARCAPPIQEYIRITMLKFFWVVYSQYSICKSWSRQILEDEYLVEKICFDTAEQRTLSKVRSSPYCPPSPSPRHAGGWLINGHAGTRAVAGRRRWANEEEPTAGFLESAPSHTFSAGAKFVKRWPSIRNKPVRILFACKIRSTVKIHEIPINIHQNRYAQLWIWLENGKKTLWKEWSKLPNCFANYFLNFWR